MKKIASLIILVLVSSFLAGCGNDQYSIERQYYWLQRKSARIFKNPNASPPRELEKTVAALDKFIKNHPDNKLSVEAGFDIARLYVVKQEYDQGRAYLRSMIDKYRKFEAICAESLFLIGNSYQIEDKWNLALEQYKKIMQNYSTTVRGLDIPVYIAQYYKISYQPDKMLTAFQEAIAHYQGLVGRYPNTVLSFQANRLIVDCYAALKDWRNAANGIETIISTYKNKMKLDGLLITLAYIYQRELKDTMKAKQALEQLVKDYPKSKFVKRATELLKELGKK